MLDILLGQKQIVKYVTPKKFSDFLVNEIVDNKKAEWLAGRVCNSGYDILKLMEDVFTSEWCKERK